MVQKGTSPTSTTEQGREGSKKVRGSLGTGTGVVGQGLWGREEGRSGGRVNHSTHNYKPKWVKGKECSKLKWYGVL